MCEECLPLCDHVNYNVGTVSISMRPAVEGNSAEDTSPVAIVKIYHAQRTSLLYVQDVISEWFNILSKRGGLV